MATYPTSTNGKLFAKQRGFGRYTCSATVVSTASSNVILTAGHCIYDLRDGWANHVMFVPAYRNGARPFGSWTWRYEVVSDQWYRSNNDNYDYAAVALRPINGRVGDVVGAQGLAWSQSRFQNYRAYGYPFNIGDTELLWNCYSAFVETDPHPVRPGPRPSGIGCNMKGGSSGGGRIIEDLDGFQYVNSVNTFTYQNIPNVLFGPYFTGKVLKIIGRASRH